MAREEGAFDYFDYYNATSTILEVFPSWVCHFTDVLRLSRNNVAITKSVTKAQSPSKVTQCPMWSP